MYLVVFYYKNSIKRVYNYQEYVYNLSINSKLNVSTNNKYTIIETENVSNT